MTDELSDEPEKWYRDAVLGFIEEENKEEILKILWRNFKKLEAESLKSDNIYEYQSGTCFFMNPTDFEIKKPTETVTMNSPTTRSLETQKQPNK